MINFNFEGFREALQRYWDENPNALTQAVEQNPEAFATQGGMVTPAPDQSTESLGGVAQPQEEQLTLGPGDPRSRVPIANGMAEDGGQYYGETGGVPAAPANSPTDPVGIYGDRSYEPTDYGLFSGPKYDTHVEWGLDNRPDLTGTQFEGAYLPYRPTWQSQQPQGFSLTDLQAIDFGDPTALDQLRNQYLSQDFDPNAGRSQAAGDVQRWHEYYTDNQDLRQLLSLDEQQDLLFLDHITGGMSQSDYKTASYDLRNSWGLDRHYSVPGRDSHRFEYQYDVRDRRIDSSNPYDSFLDTHQDVGGFFKQENLPGGSFFQDDILGNPVIRAGAAYFTGGLSEVAIAAGRALDGETLHGMDYAQAALAFAPAGGQYISTVSNGAISPVVGSAIYTTGVNLAGGADFDDALLAGGQNMLMNVVDSAFENYYQGGGTRMSEVLNDFLPEDMAQVWGEVLDPLMTTVAEGHEGAFTSAADLIMATGLDEVLMPVVDLFTSGQEFREAVLTSQEIVGSHLGSMTEGLWGDGAEVYYNDQVWGGDAFTVHETNTPGLYPTTANPGSSGITGGNDGSGSNSNIPSAVDSEDEKYEDPNATNPIEGTFEEPATEQPPEVEEEDPGLVVGSGPQPAPAEDEFEDPFEDTTGPTLGEGDDEDVSDQPDVTTEDPGTGPTDLDEQPEDPNPGGGGGGGGGAVSLFGAAGGLFDPDWSELFPYTKLTPSEKAKLGPILSHIKQVRQ